MSLNVDEKQIFNPTTGLEVVTSSR